MTLPFEQDTLSLLEACAMALLPLLPPAREDAATVTAPAAPADRQGNSAMLWQRSPGGSAVVTKRPTLFADAAQEELSFLSMPTQGINISAEALSKTFERDARRFD